jgi:2Fe-2S ferredoxin
MQRIIVHSRNGKTIEAAAEAGLTVMEIIREAGIDELSAMCGGSCSCATCHVHVADEFLPLLEPMSDGENDLLDSSGDRDNSSRLSCQIVFHAELNGMHVRVAAED